MVLGRLPTWFGILGAGIFMTASGALLCVVRRHDHANRESLGQLLHEQALASLSALTDATMADLPLERLLDELLVRLEMVLGVDTAAILLLPEGDAELIIEAWRGTTSRPEGGARVATNEGLAGCIAQNTDPVVVADTSGAEPLGIFEGLASVAGCRIIAQQRLIGVCVVGSIKTTDFHDWDVQLLRLVADRAGLAIERKLLEGGMREAQRMAAFGQVAGAVAHDFNNILTVISGYTELLRQQPDLGDDSRGMVGNISDSVARAAILTGQLLTIGRSQEPKPVVIEPTSTLRGLSEVLQRILGIDITLCWSLDPTSGNIKVDPAHFEQLILNLAINARDAMPVGGSLAITCSPGMQAEGSEAPILGPYVHLTVADTGVGMDDETRRRCFEPFYTTKAPTKGTGMGLAAVQGVVLESGGSIAVTSYLHKGTHFDIYLPRTDEPVAEVPAEPQPALAQGQETVLVAEDDASVRRLICQVLGRAGYQVIAADDGPSALVLCEQQTVPVEIVVTDLVMPGMGGPDLVERLRILWPSVAVLYLSGDTDDGVDDDRVAADVAGVLAKPFKPSELSSRVRAALDENRQARSGTQRPVRS